MDDLRAVVLENPAYVSNDKSSAKISSRDANQGNALAKSEGFFRKAMTFVIYHLSVIHKHQFSSYVIPRGMGYT